MNDSTAASRALAPSQDPVPFREAIKVWTQVALQSFGGPAGQIAVMHRILVEEKRWVSENRFLHAFNYCMLLPGPEAQQLAIYIGWLLNRTPGGLAAGILFVLPGFLAILALSILYVGFRDTTLVSALFFGLKPAVMAVVVEAVFRFLRAPYIEILRGNRSLSRALTTITAAVVGVIFNLAVWFSFHTLFGEVSEVDRGSLRLLVPTWDTLDPGALLIAIGAFLALFRWKIGMMKTLAASAVAGLIWYLAVR